MVNKNRGPRGRFTSQKVNNSTDNNQKPPLPSPVVQFRQSPIKKRRLNDGTHQSVSQDVQQPFSQESPQSPPPAQPSQQAAPSRSIDCSGEELRTQPPNTGKTEDKRTLRSQNVARPRSELANFFGDYETIVFGPQRPEDNLNAHTSLVVTDYVPEFSDLQRLDNKIPSTPSAPDPEDRAPQHVSSLANNAISRERLPSSLLRKPRGPLFRKIRLSGRRYSTTRGGHDPLSDEVYDVPHKRGERKEKQSRNWDKERAMHEKVELERLLGELRGPDWLKLMGITGASEGEVVQNYKPKRDIFVSRSNAMLDRYTAWNKREKELKREKEKRTAKEVEESSSEGDECASTSESASEVGISTKRPRHEKTQEKSKLTIKESQPFTSFFEKAHVREAAMKGHRRGRYVFAFGQAIPELPESLEFQLPDQILGLRMGHGNV